MKKEKTKCCPFLKSGGDYGGAYVQTCRKEHCEMWLDARDLEQVYLGANIEVRYGDGACSIKISALKRNPQ